MQKSRDKARHAGSDAKAQVAGQQTARNARKEAQRSGSGSNSTEPGRKSAGTAPQHRVRQASLRSNEAIPVKTSKWAKLDDKNLTVTNPRKNIKSSPNVPKNSQKAIVKPKADKPKQQNSNKWANQTAKYGHTTTINKRNK